MSSNENSTELDIKELNSKSPITILHSEKLNKMSPETKVPRHAQESVELFKAIRNNDFEAMRNLLNFNSQLSNTPELLTGNYPLHLAASAGNLELAKFLLESALSPVDPLNMEGETPLLKACLSGNAKLVKYLIAKGADPNAQDKEGWNALHNAASRGFVDIASILIVTGEVDCNPRSRSGQTALMNAAGKCDVEMVKLLLSAEANPLIRNNYDETAYDLAAQSEQAYICHIINLSERQWIRSKYVNDPALQNVSRTFNTDDIHSTALDVIHENERSFFFNPSKFSGNNLIAADICLVGSNFATPFGRPMLKEQVTLPLNENNQSNWFWMNEWKVDSSFSNLDDFGWSYAKSFDIPDAEWEARKSEIRFGTCVRRRRWIRVRKRKTYLGPPTNLTIPTSRSFVIETEEEDGYIKDAQQIVINSIKESSLRGDSIGSLETMTRELNIYQEAIQKLLSCGKGDLIRSRQQKAYSIADAYLRHAETLRSLIDTLSSSHSSQISFSNLNRISPIHETNQHQNIHFEQFPSPSQHAISHARLFNFQTTAWQPDNEAFDCRKCETQFSMFVRKHHCRWCGYIFCDECSYHRLPLKPGTLLKSRICDDCNVLLTSYDSPLGHLVPPPSPTRDSVLSETVMNECPVCQMSLIRKGMTDLDSAKHVAECFDRANNGNRNNSVSGNSYLVQKLDQDIEKECTICFEDFKKGQKIARLNCLCFYHQECIEQWLSFSSFGVRACPIHYN